MFNIFNKNKRVYLDNAGSTPVSSVSSSALIEALSFYGNPSGIHNEGREAGQLLDKARALCAKVLNAHSYEIYFAGTGTESCNLAITGTYYGFKKNNKDKVPHIITTNIEHPAVLEPIRRLEGKGKVKVTYIKVNEGGIIRALDIREALTEDTVLVSVMYANNEIGTLQPVKEIGRIIEEWKQENNKTYTAYPYFHVDACQAANYCNLDVVRLRAHLMTVNSSKVYGPKGVALLYKREGIIMEPIVYGGGQERVLRSGTESVAQAYAFGVALNEAENMKEKESARLRELRDFCKEELTKEITNITFYGAFDLYQTHDKKERKVKTELRLPNNINCRVSGISSEEMILRLDALGFAVSHKSACASQETDGSYVVMALGANEEEAMENIRITMGRQTSKQDIQRLVEAMKTISMKYAK
ncbi:MAG: cysteine desulfurase family protein [Candidatus Paceibacterota bacterium]|jgi:cysteine desulfurase